MNYYNIIVPRPINKLFTYTSEYELCKGTRVIIDFKNRKTAGVIFGNSDKIDQECKSINYILDINEPFFSKKYLQLLMVLSKNYISSYGEVLDTLINSNVLKANYKDIEGVKFNKKSLNYGVNEKTKDSISKILPLIDKDNRPILFRTDNVYNRISVYVELIKKFNLQNRQVKILCPDIVTLNKMVKILAPVFKDKIGVYYATKTLKYRKKILLGYRNGEVEIIVGTKSALGLHAKCEGLIIVEGEEDEFYKQEESPYMQYRDVAIEYAKIFEIPIILGSSIPSVESFYNARKNIFKYVYLENNKNKNNYKVNLINIKEHENISGLISMPIYEKLYNNLREKKKTLILINKKGYSNYLVCNNCGNNLMCDRCSVNATYYRSKGYCLCNYCGKRISIVCSKCGSKDFFDFGFGIENIYEALKNIFEDISILKIDKYDIAKKDGNNLIRRIENSDFDILIGTFVLLKRFDNLNIDSAIIMSMENIINLPDFRIYEKIMRLLYKFSGKIDQFSKACEYYIQCYGIDNPLFDFINKELEAFYDFEINRRRIYGYPPFVNIVRVVVQSKRKDHLYEVIKELARFVEQNKEIALIGPSTAPILKLRDNYRYNFLIKAKNKDKILDCCNFIKEEFNKIKKGYMRLKIDVDPYFFI